MEKAEKRASFLDYFFTKADLEQRVDNFFAFSERIPDVDDGKEKLLGSTRKQDEMRERLLREQRGTTERFAFSMDPLLARKLSERDCAITLQSCLSNMRLEKKSNVEE